MEPKNNLHKKIGISIGILVVIGILFVTVFAGKKSPSTQNLITPVSNPPEKVTSTPPADTTKKSTLVYKNGSYSATGSYMSPGGPDQVAVMLTLKNDIITDITVTPEPGDNTSAKYQNKFVSGYKAFVLGKNIADVNLTKISGSSLTSKGFNEAIAQIKAQAQA